MSCGVWQMRSCVRCLLQSTFSALIPLAVPSLRSHSFALFFLFLIKAFIWYAWQRGSIVRGRLVPCVGTLYELRGKEGCTCCGSPPIERRDPHVFSPAGFVRARHSNVSQGGLGVWSLQRSTAYNGYHLTNEIVGRVSLRLFTFRQGGEGDESLKIRRMPLV